MKAEIISIGSEILLGKIVDTNASYLAGQLPLLGIELCRVTQVGDNQAGIVEALRQAWSRSDLILTTGGLGPTEDDLTREAIAEFLGEEPKVDPDLAEWVRSVFRRLGREMPERNLKQATLIPSAQPIPNPRGTAPGWWVERESKLILALPGPPNEMQRMWEREIRPKLRERLGGEVIISRTLKTFGLSESRVAELINPLLPSVNPTIGVYAKPSGIQISLTAKASSQEEAEGLITPLEAQIRSLLGENIWGENDETLEKTVGILLREKGLTLATMESCTGGLIANLLTDVPGSSDYFKGGVVAYSNELKIAFGVEAKLIAHYGAVSYEVAEAMAEAVRSRLGTDVGIGITGVAGPSELEGKPVGTVYTAVSDGVKKRVIHTLYPPPRQQIKQRAAFGALFELRKLLLERG